MGFECSLQSIDSSVPGLHAWESCKSPKSYSRLGDGAYTFAVRIGGEEVVERSDFRVDISPPKTTILQVR
jgi:hypothetical protein